MTDVLGAPQERFLQYVNSDVRDQSGDEIYAALRSPEGLDRWINALRKMSRDTDSQLESDRADRSEALVSLSEAEHKEFLANKDRWRANAIRFKTGVENLSLIHI